MQSMWGSCFFSMPRMERCSISLSSTVLAWAAHVFQRTDQKAAGAAGRVQHDLADLRVHHIGHELSDGPRRVVFAGIARALQVAQDLLIDVVEEMALLHVVEVDAVDAVDDLAHQRAGLHVVVRVGEDLMHDHATRVAAGADRTIH